MPGPPTLTPFVHPTQLVFYLSEQTRTLPFNLYNPCQHDVLFKVDNARPTKYGVSLRQGVLSSQQKITLDLTCTTQETCLGDTVQVRFFKWSRPRYGRRPKPQDYVGFRSINISIYNNQGENLMEREGTPSEAGTALSGSNQGSGEEKGGGKLGIDDDPEAKGTYNSPIRLQVITNFITAISLIACGFVLNKTNEEWFSNNVLEGIRPQTLAVVSYTLAFVLMVKLLTFR